jgi:uncharacterized protein (DUF2141 family)
VGFKVFLPCLNQETLKSHYMRNFTKLFIAVFTLLLSTSTIWGQIWSNPITGTNPNTTDPYTAGQTVVANLTVSGIKRGSGIAGTNANDRFNAIGWDTPAMDANGGYFQFTLTPNAGYAINFTNFIYVSQASGTGPTSFAVRSSVDGYAANLGSPSATGATVTLTATAYQNITSAITFRVYGWGASGSGGTFSVNSFNFNGAVVSAACSAPTTQASNIIFPTVGTTSLALNWTNGNGAGRIVKMNTVNSFSLPTTGENPTANLNYGGSGSQVIYNGTGSGPITVTGLSEGTTYYFRIYEYCSPTRTYNVSTATGNGASQQTQTTTTETIHTTATAYGPFCNGIDNNIVIDYTSTGTFSGSFSAQLSDENGNFSTPSIIGSGASPITGTIAAGTVAGTGYRIRVVNDNPSTDGNDNGSDIIIQATPTLPTSITPTNICAGTSGTIEGIGSTGATSYTFWTEATGGDTITSSSVPSGSVSGNILTIDAEQSVGNYTYYVQAENVNCTSLARQTVEVNVNTVPVVDLGSDTSYCEGSAFTLTLDAGNAGASFDWNNGTAATQTFTATQAGTYSVTVTDVNGCVGADSKTITENTSPVVDLGSDTSYCEGSAFTLILDAGNAGATFEWDNGAAATQTFTATQAGTYSVTVTDVNGCVGADSKTITENTSPVVDLGSDTSYCEGSAFTLILDAGNAGATFEWNNGAAATQTFTATQAGTYSVAVTDANGCVGADSKTITENTSPVVDLGSDTSYCEGSAFTLILDAGNAGATFDWNNGTAATQTFTATQAGTYSVTVTDVNGCVGADSKTITENTSPVVDLGSDTSYCEGSAFTLTLDAGNAGASFDWNNGTAATQTFTATQAGTYSVTVTDVNGCVGADSKTITENTSPVVDLGSDTSYCEGSAFTLTLDAGNAGATFDWNNGAAATQTFTATQAGTYSVTVTDANGCVGTDSKVITEDALPVINLGNDISTAGANQVLDAGAGFASYAWTPGNQTTQQITVTQNGTYGVTVTNVDGCFASDEITVWFTASLSEFDAANFGLQIYPNPATDILNLNLDYDGTLSLEIITTSGQLFWTQKVIYTANQPLPLYLTDFPTGLYVLRLSGKGISVSRQFIINK